MRRLDDEQMKELYSEAVAKNVDGDFIELIVTELQRRGLLSIVPQASEHSERQYTA